MHIENILTYFNIYYIFIIYILLIFTYIYINICIILLCSTPKLNHVCFLHTSFCCSRDNAPQFILCFLLTSDVYKIS